MAAQDDELLRVDETQFRLLEWTQEQAPSERLAAQILDAEGYKDIDPSHPLGGPDDGRDGHCTKDGQPWTWAVYFPRGQKRLTEIKAKLTADVAAARKHTPKGIAFVTNQEIRLAERAALRSLGGDLEVDLFHLERVATILDRPRMAPVRQQYLRIGAGRPPVRVKALVIGAARNFTDDEDMIDFYVKQEEEHIRGESDKGWARVRAEEAEKARAEAEKGRARAERARRQALEQRAGDKPLSLAEIAQGAMSSTFTDMAAGINFEAFAPKFDLPQYDHTSVARLLAGGSGGLGLGVAHEPPPPPEPLSDEQIDEKVAAYRAELEGRWEFCKEYLAALAWPGLKFRVDNAEGFLTNVQVVLTFRGAKGVEHERIENFEWQKLEDPDWTEPVGPYSIGIPAPILSRQAVAKYPVKWEHDENGDLVVKITLAELRPYEIWTSNTDDIVLMLRDDALESVEVTYTVTAAEHHDRPEGEPFTVPVEEVVFRDAVLAAIDASKAGK